MNNKHAVYKCECCEEIAGIEEEAAYGNLTRIILESYVIICPHCDAVYCSTDCTSPAIDYDEKDTFCTVYSSDTKFYDHYAAKAHAIENAASILDHKDRFSDPPATDPNRTDYYWATYRPIANRWYIQPTTFFTVTWGSKNDIENQFREVFTDSRSLKIVSNNVTHYTVTEPDFKVYNWKANLANCVLMNISYSNLNTEMLDNKKHFTAYRGSGKMQYALDSFLLGITSCQIQNTDPGYIGKGMYVTANPGISTEYFLRDESLDTSPNLAKYEVYYTKYTLNIPDIENYP